MMMINRKSMVSASSSSSSTQGQRMDNGHAKFDVWSLIKRRGKEHPFCMEAKFRAGKRLHRLDSTIVTRKRKQVESEVEVDDDASSISSSGSSTDWLNSDDEEEDLFDTFERLNVNNKKLNFKGLANMLIDQQRVQRQSQTLPNQRPASGDMFVLEELTFTGSKAQKLYLKKCADFQITPCSHFVKSLSAKAIDMEHHNIGPKGAEACAVALTRATTVRSLNMNDTGMGQRGAKYMAYMLRENQKITDLSVSDNCIGVKGAKYLVDVLIDIDKVYRLDLSGNGFLEKDAEVFKLLIEEARTLKYLNLSHNEFREVGGVLIGEALNWNDGLEELDLSWNHFRRGGSVGIAEGLEDNSSLRILNLSWNGFYIEGCRALVRTLQFNSTLEVLDLSNNRINRECLGHLVKGLAKNTTLHTLILKFNPLTSDGAYDILKFIYDCPTTGIQVLDLGVQQVDPEFVTLYKEILLQKRTLDVIYGQIIGHSLANFDEMEQKILDENPTIVLVEFGKMMGFRLLDLFSSLDKDGSRTLDRDEIEKGLRMANIPLSDDCLDQLIFQLDTDGDGEIDFAELIQAHHEHRKQQTKFLQAREGIGDTKLEDTSLWRIRSLLQKLMAEKMADYPSFQRCTQMLVKQIQVVNQARDAKDESKAKYRATHPRKVKSRPSSPEKSTPVNMLILSRSPSPASIKEDILTPDLSPTDNTKRMNHDLHHEFSHEYPTLLRRNYSVQFPLTEIEHMFTQHKVDSDQNQHMITQQSKELDSMLLEKEPKGINQNELPLEYTKESTLLPIKQILDSFSHTSDTNTTQGADEKDSDIPPPPPQLYEFESNNAETEGANKRKLGQIKKEKKNDNQLSPRLRKAVHKTGKNKKLFSSKNTSVTRASSESNKEISKLTVTPKSAGADKPKAEDSPLKRIASGNDYKVYSAKKTPRSKEKDTH